MYQKSKWWYIRSLKLSLFLYWSRFYSISHFSQKKLHLMISFHDELLMMSYYCANFLIVAVILSLPNFLKKTLWYRGIIKKIGNFLYAVFSIWKSLRVLEKACIKIVPRAIYKYLFFFFCKNCPFLLPNKKLLWSLFSLTN